MFDQTQIVVRKKASSSEKDDAGTEQVTRLALAFLIARRPGWKSDRLVSLLKLLADLRKNTGERLIVVVPGSQGISLCLPFAL